MTTQRHQEADTQLVPKLMGSLVDKGYCVFLDKSLTSVDMARQLIALKTTMVGPLDHAGIDGDPRKRHKD